MIPDLAPTAPSEITWLTGATNVYVEEICRDYNLGLLTTPSTNYRHQISVYNEWAADNGAFEIGARHEDFNHDRWWRWAQKLVEGLSPVDEEHCLFLAVPDAIDVHDAATVFGFPDETLAWAQHWLPRARSFGLPLAFVAGNGIEDRLGDVPWDDLDVVFLGGSTDWKLGEGAARVTTEALARGKEVHMGRVNSGKRLRIALDLGCRSADGTFLSRGPSINLARLLRWPDIHATGGLARFEQFAA